MNTEFFFCLVGLLTLVGRRLFSSGRQGISRRRRAALSRWVADAAKPKSAGATRAEA